jgi:hypothetical protein
MLIKAIAVACFCLHFSTIAMTQEEAVRETGELQLTRQEDGLKGPVRTVETTRSDIQLDHIKTKYIANSTSRQVVSYDHLGLKTEEYSGYAKFDSSNKGKKIFVYDAMGHLQEIVKYDHAGKIGSKLTANYDNQGRMLTIAGTEHSPANLLWGETTWELKTSFVYLGKGKTVEQIVAVKDKALPPFSRSLSRFGQNKHLLDLKSYMVGFLVSHREYMYARDRLIRMNETTYDVDSGRRAPRPPSLAREFYSYDQHGNLIETKKYGSKRDGSLALQTWTLLVYEFDSAGNWVKRSASGWTYSGESYQKGVSKIVPRSVTRRVIAYYE